MGFFDYPQSEAESRPDSTRQQDFIFLDGLSAGAWKKILRHAEIVYFESGQSIVTAGERDDSFYILSKGTVEIVLDANGQVNVLGTISEGSVFGEISFFDQQPRSATIRARSHGRAIRMTREGFDRLGGWEPALARAILLDLGKILAMRLRWTTLRTGGIE